MNSCLPEQIRDLVRVGLETYESTDRLIALGVANQVDEVSESRTGFGPMVVEIFMGQFGLELEEPTGSVNMRDYTGAYVTSIEMQIMLQVSKALGDRLEVRSRFDVASLRAEHRYGNDRSRGNFQNAVKAVKAYDGEDSWPSAFAQVRGLNEVRNPS